MILFLERITIFTGILFTFHNLFVIQSASLIKAQSFNDITSQLIPLLWTNVFFINCSKLISFHSRQLRECLSCFSIKRWIWREHLQHKPTPGICFKGFLSPGHHPVKTGTIGLQVKPSSSATIGLNHAAHGQTWNNLFSQMYSCYNKC